MKAVDHIAGHTWHGRRGGPENAFRYGVDYVLLEAEGPVSAPWMFGRNRVGIASVFDRYHGGAPGAGRGAAWVREMLAEHALPAPARIELLAQPRILGHVFNPVSFWICRDAKGAVPVIVAEVTNTYGERHSYLCHRDDLMPITSHDRLRARKVFYVSPFQTIAGSYTFRFDLRPERIGIRIDLDTGDGQGVVATLTGTRRRLTNAGLLRACLRRPFGSRRVLALIHWQALKLWWKGAPFRRRPDPPEAEISR